MTDLTSLIEKLEKAEGPSRELDAYIHFRDRVSNIEKIAAAKTGHINIRGFDFSGGTVLLGENVPVYTSSIDAAVSLAERVLPKENPLRFVREAISELGKTHDWHIALYKTEQAAGLPRYIVLATLRALQSKGGEA